MTNDDSLPIFKYFPDPIADGVVKESNLACRCCKRRRGYIYTGPAYALAEYEEAFCPWCIASGSAAAMFDVAFTDSAGIGGYGAWERVPDHVIQELVTRTPGFNGWQSEQWFPHCGDAAAYLGRAGHDELKGEWSGAVESIRARYRGEHWDAYFPLLDREGECTAYVFRCLHCGQLGGYSDWS